MTLLEGMILVLFVVWLIMKYRKGETATFSNYKIFILLLLVCASVSIYFAGDRMSALGIWKAYFIEPILFFIVFINTVRDKKAFALIIDSLAESALLVAVPAVVQKFIAIGITNPFWAAEATRRVVSWYGYPNAVGLFLAPIAVLLFGIIIFRWNELKIQALRDWRTNFYSVTVTLSVLAIVWAHSEGAIVGMAAGLILLGVIMPFRKIKIITVVGVVAIVGLIAFTPMLRTVFIEKVTLMDRSGQIRQAMWGDTWRMLRDGRIIAGAGLDNYQEAVKPYYQRGIFFNNGDPDFQRLVVFNEEYRKQVWQPYEIYMYPHNMVLNFWSEIGLFGLLAIVFLIMRFYFNYLRVDKMQNRYYYRILLSVMAVVIVHGLVDVPYFKNDLSVLWWTLFGLSVLLLKRDNIIDEIYV